MGSSSLIGRPASRQRNNEFRKNTRLGIDVDLAAVLFHHNVVAHRKTEAGALARGLGGEERIEHLFLDLERDASAVVANADLDAIAQAFCRGAQRRLEIV